MAKTESPYHPFSHFSTGHHTKSHQVTRFLIVLYISTFQLYSFHFSDCCRDNRVQRDLRLRRISDTEIGTLNIRFNSLMIQVKPLSFFILLLLRLLERLVLSYHHLLLIMPPLRGYLLLCRATSSCTCRSHFINIFVKIKYRNNALCIFIL